MRGFYADGATFTHRSESRANLPRDRLSFVPLTLSSLFRLHTNPILLNTEILRINNGFYKGMYFSLVLQQGICLEIKIFACDEKALILVIYSVSLIYLRYKKLMAQLGQSTLTNSVIWDNGTTTLIFIFLRK